GGSITWGGRISGVCGRSPAVARLGLEHLDERQHVLRRHVALHTVRYPTTKTDLRLASRQNPPNRLEVPTRVLTRSRAAHALSQVYIGYGKSVVKFGHTYVDDENDLYRQTFDHRAGDPYNEYAYDDLDRLTDADHLVDRARRTVRIHSRWTASATDQGKIKVPGNFILPEDCGRDGAGGNVEIKGGTEKRGRTPLITPGEQNSIFCEVVMSTNWERGARRLTLVISVLVAIVLTADILRAWAPFTPASIDLINLVSVPIAFTAVWVIYALIIWIICPIIRYVVRGFRS
ncbi:MAG: hypothetical protein ACOX8I_10660, partial [Bacillota bacterium]